MLRRGGYRAWDQEGHTSDTSVREHTETTACVRQENKNWSIPMGAPVEVGCGGGCCSCNNGNGVLPPPHPRRVPLVDSLLSFRPGQLQPFHNVPGDTKHPCSSSTHTHTQTRTHTHTHTHTQTHVDDAKRPKPSTSRRRAGTGRKKKLVRLLTVKQQTPSATRRLSAAVKVRGNSRHTGAHVRTEDAKRPNKPSTNTHTHTHIYTASGSLAQQAARQAMQPTMKCLASRQATTRSWTSNKTEHVRRQ